MLTLEQLEDRTVPTLLGNQLFPADNPWNQNVSAAPVASNSTAVMNNLTALFGDGRLHPDFGQDTGTGSLYGIPYNVVHGNTQPLVHVVIDAYASESDLQNAPVPINAVLEGDLQSGPQAGLGNRGDSHLIVYDVDHNVAYEFFQASRPSENADGQWHADQESVWNLSTDSFRTIGWTSADAAGLPILPGLVRPDEGLPVSQGGQGVINHAIRFTLTNQLVLSQFIYPASHSADPNNTNTLVQPPMGTRFRLKAGIDISALNPESRIVAQAMKDYGLILADNGSNFFFSGASYSVDARNNVALTWNDADIQDTAHGLKSLTYSDFEVVDLTPAVTGLSASSGAAGATVTVTGRNFAGSAGHIQVLFGSTPATNVTVVDDSHLTATVPAGTGTVDVRVQSGINAPGNPGNIKNPIFGYGTSVVTPIDQFTYGSSPWLFVGGTWTQSGGALSETSTAPADVRKAEMLGQILPATVEVDARVRVDSWAGGDYARAGVGLDTDPVTGEGYNLVFHNTTGAAGVVQFLDDHVRWGNAYTFAWTVGTWYDFKLRTDRGTLYGKVWQDGTPEPADWQFSQSGWTDRSAGNLALNGGAGGVGDSTVSFDSVTIVRPQSSPTGLTATAASSSQINLSWNGPAGATGYKVQRSPDGAGNWVQIGTGPGTNYSDTGLSASTTYYYRVSATGAGGDSVFSAVAQATTQGSSSVLFNDDFSGPTLNAAWQFVGGTWSKGTGVLSQTATTNGDPRKAIVTGQTFPANVEVDAKVRVDRWAGGDYARAGVGLYTDPTTGLGYNLVFHNTTGGAGTVQFLDDHVAWGNAYSFNWSAGVWYDFKLAIIQGVLYGKVWQDGTAEPTTWQFSQSGWTDRTGGDPSLNGGDTLAGNGSSTASFTNVVVKPA
ncbi:MAG: IPT/TIG domain-containing protein [Gemmataceae bacterium]